MQALTHDATYGGITRTASSNTADWAQAASLDGSFTDWNTSRSIGPDLIEQMQDAVMEHAGDYTASDFLFVMGPANYRALRKFVVAQHITTNPGLLNVNYGIESFEMGGWEIAKDYRLQAKYINGIGTSGTTAANKWVFCFCIPTWELRFHQSRRFRFSGFTWQAMIAGGRDQYLARILGSGNFVCWQPNANCFQANIT